MVAYRRVRQPQATYFFTLALHDRSNDLLVRHHQTLRQAIQDERKKHSFTTEAIVILPDHLHCIWTLPPDDHDYSTRWRSIKSSFVRAIRKAGVDVQYNQKGEADVWQRRFWERLIRDESDLENHINYIHFNPVRHGFVKMPVEWPLSSFHEFVKQGLLPKNWGSQIELNFEVLGDD